MDQPAPLEIDGYWISQVLTDQDKPLIESDLQFYVEVFSKFLK